MSRVKVKICCISSLEESKMAIATGAAALGLVAEMPSGPGVISDTLIKEISADTPSEVDTFLLTSRTTADRIIAHHDDVKTTTLQLVDRVEIPDLLQIKTTLPNIQLVQVIHVTDDSSLDEALMFAPYVDALLLDSGNPNLDIKVLGGTGKTHNWEVSRKIVDQSDVPVFLAGGLNAGNVKRAVDKVQPYGVDLCSGVRTDGALDQAKLTEFFSALGY